MTRPTSAAKVSHVSVEDFCKQRDQIVHGLTEIQRVVSNLLAGYTFHTNKLLGVETYSEDEGHPNPLLHNIPGRAASEVPVAEAGAKAGKEGKKKEKKPKKEKDPNAPKKPLTLYFFYAEAARPVVAQDLDLDPNDKKRGEKIQQEVLRRYTEMPDEEKAYWRKAYDEAYKKYEIELKAYNEEKIRKAAEEGKPHADVEMTDAEAGAADSDAEGAEAPPVVEEEDEEDEEEEPSPPPKAPTPPAEPKSVKTPKNPRRKAAKENGIAAPAGNGLTSSPPPSTLKASRVPLPGENSSQPPESKRGKRDGAEQSAEEPKKKKPRKTREAKASTPDAAKESPAAAPEKEKKVGKKRTRKSEGAQA